MRVSSSTGDLLDVVLALRLRTVTPAEAARLLCCAEYVDGDRSLLDRLAEVGDLPPPRRQAIESLRTKYLAAYDGQPESCLEGLGIDDEAMLVLSDGSEEEVAALLDSQTATLGGGAMPGPLPRGGDSTQPENPTIYVGDAHAFHSLSSRSGGESPVRFRRIRLHAKGGLGKVSVAEDEQFRRRVALKEIRERHADSPESRARFIREAEITGALEHPGIVPVYALGQNLDGRPFYVMRLIRGSSMQAAIDRLHRRREATVSDFATPDTVRADDEAAVADEPRQPRSRRADRKATHQRELRRLLRRFLAVCDTMQYAHSRGVIHRDLKPANIMLGRYGETLVVDWGLAKTLQSSDLPAADEGEMRQPGTGRESHAATLTGRVIGTPGFMSPEQALGDIEKLGPASDVFSLGATLYCLLTGRPPVVTASVEEEIEQIRQRSYPRPRELNRSVARPMEAICLKALSWAPEDRYPSAAAFAEDLERWLADEPVRAWREPLVHRAARWMRRHRSWTAAGAAALILITAVSLIATARVNAARKRAATAQQNEAIERQRAEAQRAEAQRLAASLLVKDVEALRRDRPLGWTWKGLEQLEQAVRLAPEALDFVQVRTLAAACLSSIDARLHGDFARSQISHCVAFSPDSKLLAIAVSKSTWTGPATVTLVETATGDERVLSYSRDMVWEFRNGRTDGGRSIAFSPDGAWLVVGTRSGWVYRWNLSDLDAAPAGWKPRGGQVEIHELLFSPSGESLYAVSRNARGQGSDTICTITRWPTSDWPSQPTALRELQGVVHLASVSDPLLLLACGNEVHWLNAETLQDAPTSPAAGASEIGPVRDVASCPDVRLLAGEYSPRLFLIDERTRRAFLPLRDPRLGDAAHAGNLRAIDLGQRGRLLATGANEDGVKVWDTASGILELRIPLVGSETTAPEFSPDGRWLASPADQRTVLYELQRSDVVAAAALQSDPLEQFAYETDGEQFLCATRRGSDDLLELSVWSAGDRQHSWTMPAEWDSETRPQWAVNSRGLGVCVPPGKAAHWFDVRSAGETRPVAELPGSPRFVGWSHSGDVLWVVQGESEIQAWTAATNEHFPTLSLLREFTTSSHAIVTGRQTILCLATAGQRALAGLDNGLVMVMDGTSPGGAEYWPSQGNLVHSLAVSSDGRLAAAGTDRGVISLFHFSGGDDPAHLTAFRGHAVASVALDRRGEWLAAASTAGALRVWRRRNGGFEVYATLREADGRGVRVEFHPTQPSLAAQVEGRRALDVWSLDELERHIDFLGAAR